MKSFLFACFFLGALVVQGQSLCGVSGGVVQNSSISIEYAVGEVAITTLQSTTSSYTMTQGLLQPFIIAIAPVIKPFQIPNSFSPNGDNINDVWNIPGLETYGNSRVSVYNRYGQEVYRTTGTYVSWNGKQNNQPLPIGVYYYVIEPESGKHTWSGWLLLIR